MEQHTNWEIIDENTFAKFRKLPLEKIVDAYVDEALKESPNYDRMVALAELGQGRFSIVNSYENRRALFDVWVKNTFKEKGL